MAPSHRSFRILAGLVLALVVSPATAETPAWVLALPPPNGHTAGTNSSGQNVVADILTSFDRQAPIEQWHRGQSYDSGDACETARLAHVERFGAAKETVADHDVSEATRRQLVDLAREALGRCVPAAFAPAN